MRKIYLKIGNQSITAEQCYGARFFAELDLFDQTGAKADFAQYTALNTDGAITTNSRLQARPVAVKLVYDGRKDTIDVQHATMEMLYMLCNPHEQGILIHWSDIGSKRSIAVRPTRTLLVTKIMHGMYWATCELVADDPYWYADEKAVALLPMFTATNNCGQELDADIIFTSPGYVSCGERTITCIKEIETGDRVYYCGRTGRVAYQKYLSNEWVDDSTDSKILKVGSQSIKLRPGNNALTATATGKVIYKPKYYGVI